MAAGGFGALFAGIAATVDLIAEGIAETARLEAQNDAKRREAALLRTGIERIKELMLQGEIDLDDALIRINQFAEGASADFRKAITDATEKGVEAITLRNDAALDNIDTQLEFAKENSDRAETKEIERLQREIGDLRKGFETTQEKTRAQTTQRRLVGASAVAVLRKNQQVFSQAVNMANETSGRLRGDITFGINRAVNQANLQQRQLARETGAQQAQLQAQAGQQIGQAELGISTQAFGAGEQRRLGFESRRDALARQQLELELGAPTDILTPEQLRAQAFGGALGSSAETFAAGL